MDMNNSFRLRWLSVLLLACLFALAGCTTADGGGEEPGWLGTLYDRTYDEATYLCAVGSGSTREKAVDAALSSLSQVFNAQVRSETTVTALSTASTDTAGTVKFTEDTQLVDRGTVTSNTDKIVGAEVVNTYVDRNAVVYVRVALHRQRTASLYEAEIGELSASMQKLRLRAMTTENPLVAYFALYDAYATALRQQSLLDQVQVLDKKTRKSMLPLYERELSDLASAISVAVKADGEEATKIEAAFAQTLTGLGFSVAGDEEAATATLSIDYSATPVPMENSPYKYARYTLSVSLMASDLTVLSYQKADRIAALSDQEAMAKAVNEACKEASGGFVQALRRNLGTTE